MLITSALSVAACNKKNEPAGEKATISVYAPDGAPALAISKFISDGESFGTGAKFEYHVVDQSEIGAYAGAADVIVMPVNAASKIYSAKSYKTAGVITHGNLYIMSKTPLTAEDLVGKVVGVANLANVPGLTLKAALNKKGIDYEDSDQPVEGKVALKDYAAKELIPALKSGKVTIGVLAEPAASNLIGKDSGFTRALDLQELYDPNAKAFPQAVMMLKTSIIDLYPDLISNIANKFDGVDAWLKANAQKATGAIGSVITEGVTPSLTAEILTSEVIDNCKIYWQSAADAKNDVTAYLSAIHDITPSAAAEAGDDFFA